MSCNVRRLKLCKTLCFGSDVHQRIPAPFCSASISPGADLLTFNLDDKQTSESPLSFVRFEKKKIPAGDYKSQYWTEITRAAETRAAETRAAHR